ncbi:ABC-three component system middle component 2 [Proteiniclasticum sp.]|uniref:ABC-three component system middle component 2 n=1 Tax=Proteiniclasticum sp. TaxID=2053595 RepID=UPI00289B2E94|nr:ABC-three component system middle component 2 [Proteiniclasticum sp.]
MNILLGSAFEACLRILLLLEAAQEHTLMEDTIAPLDFIAVYSRDFGMSDSNLHGSNKYRFGEYAHRRELVQSALKRLVLDGLIYVSQTNKGYEYTLSRNGIELLSNLHSDYADDYYDTATQVMVKTKGKSGEGLTNIINRRIIASLEEG